MGHGKIILAIAGPVRAGKSTFCSTVLGEEYQNVVYSSWSEIIARYVNVPTGASLTREDYTATAIHLWEERGLHAPADIFLNELDFSKGDIFIADGVRHPAQWERIRAYCNGNRTVKPVLVYIDAPMDERWRRCRAVARFPEDIAVTLPGFWRRERDSITEAMIPELKPLASLVISNTKTLDAWKAESVDTFTSLFSR